MGPRARRVSIDLFHPPSAVEQNPWPFGIPRTETETDMDMGTGHGLVKPTLSFLPSLPHLD